MYFPRSIQGLQAPSGHVMGTGIALSYGDDIDQPRERSWLLGFIRAPSSTLRGWYWPPFSCSRDAQVPATPVPWFPKAPQGTTPPSASTRAFKGQGHFPTTTRGTRRSIRTLWIRIPTF